MTSDRSQLADVAPDLAQVLGRSMIRTPARYGVSEIRCETVMVSMRDDVRLATDLYLPPSLPAPAIAVRTPYGKGIDDLVGVFFAFARRGYVVIAQDCRGTGASEPDTWDYSIYEPEDGYDTVEWVSRQSWFDGFIGACGGSYVGFTQWPMAMHPCTSAVAPEMCTLVTSHTAHIHMFANAYARSVGKGDDKVSVPYSELEPRMLKETLATGYFNEPLHTPLPAAVTVLFPELRALPAHQARRRLWERYCSLSCAERAELLRRVTGTKGISMQEVEAFPEIFGMEPYRVERIPHMSAADLGPKFQAPALMITGWYDWGLDLTLASWDLLMQYGREPVRSRSRLLITPSAHNMPGYHEGMADHPELQHAYRTPHLIELLLRWYAAVREHRLDSWPAVTYYLMGANEWRVAGTWPPTEARIVPLYLDVDRVLTSRAPRPSKPDTYIYDPEDPTPTVGGSIVSYVYPPGSVDISEVQKRKDVLTYTTARLETDLDVVGPLRLILFVSSTAPDTDFAARLSDVFPDGRAIQLQSGMLRARYRKLHGKPELLVPGQVHELQIDMWATANRFKAGHRLRLDISSADFPRFDRNTNRGGSEGPPTLAQQSVHHDPDHPSRLLLSVLGSASVA